ncbi:hypothetical protein BJ875DRAFT_454592 [Amylocarpus encephaloides]|uniref:Alcohol acetyltransferase n=1 Tax=Amylocarpus encephaloides TaxID=45428 RepID=A0A9P7YP74_9HELO|nr:hypothetical protein BJ875DRAFT_454592 [Amylocarpus encephaloides]
MDTQVVPAGVIARYFAARNTRGIYRSFAGSGVYTLPLNPEASQFTELLQYALAKTIARHPALCFGLVDKSGASEAHFVRLHQIEWDDVVELQTSSGPVEKQDEVLERHMEIAHNHIWQDQTIKPGWKIIVIRHANPEENFKSRVDLIWPCHHALADGGSGAAFHKTFHQHLSEGLKSPSNTSRWPHPIPPTTPLPITIEEACPLPPNASLAVSKPEFHPPWLAKPPSLSPYATRVLLLTIPNPQVATALKKCRSLHITMTSLLHSLILLYLSRTLPPSDANAFRSCTPYSMRRFSGISDDELVNHISFITSYWDPAAITALRSVAGMEGKREEDDALRRVGTQLQSEIKDELSRVPEAGCGILLALAPIKDLDAYLKEKLRVRGDSYEVSNIGLVTIRGNPTDEGDGVKVEKLAFSQCAMVAGAVIGCSVASLAGGPMMVSLTWQEGIVGEDVVRGLREWIGRRFEGFRG